jgi:hypothetical protein
MLLAQSLMVGGGDPAAAWRSALDALQLAPRSLRVVDAALNTALALRRYGEARELVARRQALDPTSGRGDWWAANVALAVGDTAGVARAFRAYQAKGGRDPRVRPGDLGADFPPCFLMRYADRATGDALLAGTPASFGAETGVDSVNVYYAQAELLLMRGDTARTRAAVARGLATFRGMSVEMRTGYEHLLSWLAAAQGDRAAAEGALALLATRLAALRRATPGGLVDAYLACMRADVEALLGDVTALLAPLRRCLTMPSGYPVATLRTNPAFARHAADPRVRALAAGPRGGRAARPHHARAAGPVAPRRAHRRSGVAAGHEAAGDGRTLGDGGAAPPATAPATAGRAPVGRQPRDAERDSLRAAWRHSVAHAAAGTRLRLGRDVLAAASGMAAAGRLEAAAPAHAGAPRGCPPNRLDAGEPGQPEPGREKGEPPSDRTRPTSDLL